MVQMLATLGIGWPKLFDRGLVYKDEYVIKYESKRSITQAHTDDRVYTQFSPFRMFIYYARQDILSTC